MPLGRRRCTRANRREHAADVWGKRSWAAYRRPSNAAAPAHGCHRKGYAACPLHGILGPHIADYLLEPPVCCRLERHACLPIGPPVQEANWRRTGGGCRCSRRAELHPHARPGRESRGLTSAVWPAPCSRAQGTRASRLRTHPVVATSARLYGRSVRTGSASTRSTAGEACSNRYGNAPRTAADQGGRQRTPQGERDLDDRDRDRQDQGAERFTDPVGHHLGVVHRGEYRPGQDQRHDDGEHRRELPSPRGAQHPQASPRLRKLGAWNPDRLRRPAAAVFRLPECGWSGHSCRWGRRDAMPRLHVGHRRPRHGGQRPRRRPRPGRAPVCRPRSMTIVPFTTTYSIPVDSCRGSS